MEKRQLDSSRSDDFSLLRIDLDLDLEKKAPKSWKRERIEGLRARINLLRCPPSTNLRAKPLPLENGHFEGFEVKPKKMEEKPWERRVGAAAFIAQI